MASSKSRGLFGLACLCALGLATFMSAGAPSVGAAESFPGQGFLPNGRAWEMVSPPDKNGGGIAAMSFRTRAASDGDAVQYMSLTGFADVAGMGVSADYIAQRSDDPAPGDNGWGTHAITPPLDAVPFGANLTGSESRYEGTFSDDLSAGIFGSTTPLTDAPNVGRAVNLYLRDDLLDPGAGNYQLLTDCLSPPAGPCAEPLSAIVAINNRPWVAGASEDFGHVIFESLLPLVSGATATASSAINLYESDHGVLRLAGVLPDGTVAARSIAGRGVSVNAPLRNTSHPISADGSRIFFTVQNGGSDTFGHLYARVGHHVTIHLNASERATPLPGKAATYQDASVKGDRVFFLSPEPLTDSAPNNAETKAYMWAKQPSDEQQSLTVDAGSGTFTLSSTAAPVVATGNTSATTNKNKIKSVSTASGLFAIGQSITGPGIPVGTRITAINGSATELTISQNATATASGVALKAGYTSTTAALPFDAAAVQVQVALEALPAIGTGNVSVSGGPGSPGGATPYAIAFGGELAGTNVPQLSANATGLSGGAATATVSTTQPVKNLTYLNVDGQPADSPNEVKGFTGVSEKGDYAYFIAKGQLVAGKPTLPTSSGLYLWHEGSISFVGELESLGSGNEIFDGSSLNLVPKQVQISPDGRHLLFASKHGGGLLSQRGGVDYDHGACGGGNGCRELYLYSADTDTLQCASCIPSGAAATVDADLRPYAFLGGAQYTSYLNRPLSDNGRYVFFTTAEKLVAVDTNGVEDAYVFDSQAGKSHLISSGESAAPSYFLDASASGEDAFFLTAEQLSGWDVDMAHDLYDARVGGGLPEPPPAPPGCQGDACQPAPLALNDLTPASSAFNGPSNESSAAKPGTHCAKSQRQVKRRGRTRCVKRGKRQKRDANSNRRAGR